MEEHSEYPHSIPKNWREMTVYHCKAPLTDTNLTPASISLVQAELPTSLQEYVSYQLTQLLASSDSLIQVEQQIDTQWQDHEAIDLITLQQHKSQWLKRFQRYTQLKSQRVLVLTFTVLETEFEQQKPILDEWLKNLII